VETITVCQEQDANIDTDTLLILTRTTANIQLSRDQYGIYLLGLGVTEFISPVHDEVNDSI